LDKDLQRLYSLHDHLESALRNLTHLNTPGIRKVRQGVWAAHDHLERLVISEQAKRGMK